MAFARDLLLNNGLPIIENGDIAFGYSDSQHIHNLLFSKQGDWREFPQAGVNISKFLNETDDLPARLKFERIVTVNLKADGYINIKHLTKSILYPKIKADR